MLVTLTRRAGESIIVDNGIVVKVIRINGEKVTLGVEAPAETPIRRAEVEAWMKAEGAATGLGSLIEDAAPSDQFPQFPVANWSNESWVVS